MKNFSSPGLPRDPETELNHESKRPAAPKNAYKTPVQALHKQATQKLLPQDLSTYKIHVTKYHRGTKNRSLGTTKSHQNQQTHAQFLTCEHIKRTLSTPDVLCTNLSGTGMSAWTRLKPRTLRLTLGPSACAPEHPKRQKERRTTTRPRATGKLQKRLRNVEESLRLLITHKHTGGQWSYTAIPTPIL